MPKPIHRQVMVITGATSGIGLGTALAAARQGAKVALCARNKHALRDVVRHIRRNGGAAIAVPADVTSYNDMKRVARRTVRAFGRIDTWVSNAGVTAYAPFRELSLDDAQRIMDVNFIGQLNSAKAALPQLERTRGALICLGSALSDRGMPLQSVYSASKHAIKGWLDALRLELRNEGSHVRVTLIKPSAINTPLYSNAKTQLGVTPRPLPPVYDPHLVVNAILRAATRNRRDSYVGGSGKLLSIGERISPRVVDAILQVYGFRAHLTRQRESARSPHNLYAPLEYDGNVRGEFSRESHDHSWYQSVASHPVLGLLAVSGVLMAISRMRNRSRPISEARDAPGPLIMATGHRRVAQSR